ncbi:MAG: hypothetical protein U0T56_01705 [Ferruginibacter sp.]
MNRVLHNLLIFLALSFLSSCSTGRHSFSRIEQMYEAREKGKNCFVQFADGRFKQYRSLELVRALGQAPHLLADNNTRIYPDEVLCYQNADHYAISSQGFLIGGHLSKISSETLPGFAVRIMKGKLNVYVKKYKNGARILDEFYFQQGNRREVLVYTPELMDALIKNMPEALEFYNAYRKHLPKNRDLIATAYIFNQTYMASRK